MSDKTDLSEDDLFGDLDLSEQQQAQPQTPVLTDLSGQEQVAEPIREPAPRPRMKTTTTALKKPPGRDLTGVFILLGIVLVFGGGGVGALYFLGLGPFAAPTPVRPRAPIAKPKQHDKITAIVQSSPEGASIKVNGVLVKGIKTPYKLKLLSGRKYKLTFEKKGYGAMTHEIDATKLKSKTVEVDVKLEAQDVPPMKGDPAVVFLECWPIGAKVFVLGKEKGECSAKTLRVELRPGTSKLEVKKEGFETSEVKFTLKPSEIKMHKLRLEKDIKPRDRPKARSRKRPRTRRPRRRRRPRGAGSVSLTCSPAADVFWKGDKIGRTPLTHKFPAGRHKLVLRSGALKALKVVSIRVKAKKTTKESFRFTKGKLKFIIKPWANVTLNGKSIGQTPIPPPRVYEGFHKVVLRFKGKKKEMRVRVRGGETTPVIHIFP